MSNIREEIPGSEVTSFREIYTQGGQEYAAFSYYKDFHTPEKFAMWVVVPKKALEVFSPLHIFLSYLFDEVKMGVVGEWSDFARVRYLIRTNSSYEQTLPKHLAEVVVRMLPLIRRSLLVIKESKMEVEE